MVRMTTTTILYDVCQKMKTNFMGTNNTHHLYDVMYDDNNIHKSCNIQFYYQYKKTHTHKHLFERIISNIEKKCFFFTTTTLYCCIVVKLSVNNGLNMLYHHIINIIIISSLTACLAFFLGIHTHTHGYLKKFFRFAIKHKYL